MVLFSLLARGLGLWSPCPWGSSGHSRGLKSPGQPLLEVGLCPWKAPRAAGLSWPAGAFPHFPALGTQMHAHMCWVEGSSLFQPVPEPVSEKDPVPQGLRLRARSLQYGAQDLVLHVSQGFSTWVSSRACW